MLYVSQTPLLTLSEPKKPATNNALESMCEWRLRHLADNIFFQAKRWKDVGSIKANILAWTIIKPKGAAFVQAFPACEGHLASSHIRLYPSKLLFSGGEFFAGKWVSERDLIPPDGSYFVANHFPATPPPRCFVSLPISGGKWWSNFWRKEVTVDYWWQNEPLPCEDL